jgi:3-hydroxyacyl-CoA dehydrogenase
MEQYVAAGRLGRKSGRGVFDYAAAADAKPAAARGG